MKHPPLDLHPSASLASPSQSARHPIPAENEHNINAEESMLELGTFGARFYHERGGSIYHKYEDCPQGSQIALGDRKQGSGGLDLCPDCQDIARAEAEGTKRDTFRPRRSERRAAALPCR